MKKGYSLVEIMVVLAALAGVALLVTKIGQNSQSIQNEAVVMSDYNELVREVHFLMANPNSCKVSLEGVSFSVLDFSKSITGIELWSADSRGKVRKKKLVSKNEKFKSLAIEDTFLTIDAPPTLSFPDGAKVKSTASLKITLGKEKIKNQLSEIEHNFYVNFVYNAAKNEAVITDCGGGALEDKEANVWCGSLANPCGTEKAEVIGIGRYQDGKFTGIFQPVADTTEKFCLAAKNHDAAFKRCD